MKNLTAVIFSGLLATYVGAANADIASSAYVDRLVGDVADDVTELTQTVEGLVSDVTDLETQVNNKQAILDYESGTVMITGDGGVVKSWNADNGSVTVERSLVATGDVADKAITSAKLADDVRTIIDGRQAELGAENVITTTGNGVVKTVSAVDGVITATRETVKTVDIADDAVTMDKLGEDVTTQLDAKQLTSNMVNEFGTNSAEDTTHYPSVAAVYNALSEASSDTDAAIEDALEDLTNTDEAVSKQFVTVVKQESGLVSVERAQVALSDLDTTDVSNVAEGAEPSKLLVMDSDGQFKWEKIVY